MEAIRKKIKRNRSSMITVKLPDNFKAENLELIILPDEDEIKSNENSTEEYKEELNRFPISHSDWKY